MRNSYVEFFNQLYKGYYREKARFEEEKTYLLSEEFLSDNFVESGDVSTEYREKVAGLEKSAYSARLNRNQKNHRSGV